MKLELKKDKWKIKFEQSNWEGLTSNMKPPIVTHKSVKN